MKNVGNSLSFLTQLHAFEMTDKEAMEHDTSFVPCVWVTGIREEAFVGSQSISSLKMGIIFSKGNRFAFGPSHISMAIQLAPWQVLACRKEVKPTFRNEVLIAS